MKPRKVITILLILALALGLAACVQADTAQHEHSWRERTRTEAACTQDGQVTWYCSCGETKNETLPALGHAWDGGAVTAQPSCEGAGVKTFTCTRCGATRTESIPAAGHKPETIPGQPATCDVNGLTEGSRCSVCGATLKAQSPIPAYGHNWGPWQEGKLPTCEEKGKNYSVCANCGATRYRDDIEPLGHDWDEGVVIKPGYLEEGEILYTCKRDPSHTKTEVIPPSVQDDPVSISTFMGQVVYGGPPKDPGVLSGEPLTIVKDLTDTQLPEDGTGLELSVEVTGGTPPYSYSWIREYLIKEELVTELIGDNAPVLPVCDPGWYCCYIMDSAPTPSVVTTAYAAAYRPLFITRHPSEANLVTNDIMICEAEDGVYPYTYEWRTVDQEGSVTGVIDVAKDVNIIYPAELGLEPGTMVNCLVRDRVGNERVSITGIVYSAEPLVAHCTEPLLLREGEKADFGAWGEGGVPPYTGEWRDSVGNVLPAREGQDGGYYLTEISNGGYASYTFVLTDSMEHTDVCHTGYDYRELTITQQPKGCTLPLGGGEHTLTISVEDGVEPYTYTLLGYETKENMGGECFFTVTEPDWYEIYIEDAEGNYAYSDFAIVDAAETVHIASYTDDAFITQPNGGAELCVTAEGGAAPYSYAWQLEEHGPWYEPGRFREAESDDGKLTVFEPGAIYSCTVTDAVGDKACAEVMRVYYAGSPWFLRQPQGVKLPHSADGKYSVSLDCTVISTGSSLSYQWFADNGGELSRAVTIERGPYGGYHYEGKGSAKQISATYYCLVTDSQTGEKALSEGARVSVEMGFAGIREGSMEDEWYNPKIELEIDCEGGVPPYKVHIKGHGCMFDGTYQADSVSPFCKEVFRYMTLYENGYYRKSVSYTITVTDSTGQRCTTEYSPTLYDGGEGVTPKITFE